MSPAILATVKNLFVNNTGLDEEKISSIIIFLRYYKTGEYIYPGNIKRKFKLSMDEVYNLMHLLEINKIVETNYELYCFACNKTNGTAVVFNELPENFYCECCHEEINTIRNTIIIYKVIKDA